MPDDPTFCEERDLLSQGVSKAVQAVYEASMEQYRAIITKRNDSELRLALRVARVAEQDAVAALELHKREHGCG